MTHANALFQCRDTFWVESFNHHLLTYLPKRIHFRTDTFKMCMRLAVLDWVSLVTSLHGIFLYIYSLAKHIHIRLSI